MERWLASLPFAPTPDQRAAFADIDKDLDSGEPMQRLLMGEVGSGKTVVAVYAMLRALEAGHQAALMAPTETLAEQHAITLGRLLAAEATPFALLTGATTAPVRRRALDQLASGELGLIVGTHALIEPTVRFARLGLCVVDEQHRFGVEQRRALDSKGVEGMAPHVLHMTATPIPRTLSLTAYGDLDTTALHNLPAGRKPVTTRVAGEEDREGVYEFLRARLREGRQAFVVCPLVEVSEKMPGKAAGEEAERLRRGPLRDFRVGLLHGQMHSDREGRGDARLRRRGDRRAGGDDGDRGRDRRAERDRDADRGGRALRRLPAPPAARPGRARRASLAVPAVRRRGGGDGAAAALGGGGDQRRVPARRGRPACCAARARSSAPARAAPPRFTVARCPTTRRC